MDPSQYCLISSRNYVCTNDQTKPSLKATQWLKGKYCHLPQDTSLSLLSAASILRNQWQTTLSSKFNGANKASGTIPASIHRPTLLVKLRRLAKATASWIDDRICLRRQILYRATNISRIVASEKCTAIVACSGDLIDLPASCLAAQSTNVPFVAYMFDDFSTNNGHGFRGRLAKAFMLQIVEQAAAVIVPNAFLAEKYQRIYNVPSWVIPNPIDMAPITAPTLRPMNAPARIVYTGAIYEAHFDAIRNVLFALKAFETLPAPQLHLYTPSATDYLEAHQIGNPAYIHSGITANEATRQQQGADIVLLPLAFESRIPDTVNTSAPGKMGELLACGRPVLVHAPMNSFVSTYFRKHGCGIVVDDNDPIKLRDAIAQLITDPAYCRVLVQRAIECARRDFSLSQARSRFLALLSNVVVRDAA